MKYCFDDFFLLGEDGFKRGHDRSGWWAWRDQRIQTRSSSFGIREFRKWRRIITWIRYFILINIGWLHRNGTHKFEESKYKLVNFFVFFCTVSFLSPKNTPKMIFVQLFQLDSFNNESGEKRERKIWRKYKNFLRRKIINNV